MRRRITLAVVIIMTIDNLAAVVEMVRDILNDSQDDSGGSARYRGGDLGDQRHHVQPLVLAARSGRTGGAGGRCRFATVVRVL